MSSKVFGQSCPCALQLQLTGPLSWVDCAHCWWLSLAYGSHSYISNFLGSPLKSWLHSHSSMYCPLGSCLQGPWTCHILFGLTCFPLKSRWKPLWSCNSCILQAAKPESCGQNQSLQPTWSVLAGPSLHFSHCGFWVPTWLIMGKWTPKKQFYRWLCASREPQGSLLKQKSLKVVYTFTPLWLQWGPCWFLTCP